MAIAFNIPAEKFKEKYQEKKPLLIKQAVSKTFVSWKEANEVYTHSDAVSEDLKLLLDGLIPKNQYVESFLEIGTLRYRLIKPAVYEYLRNGATLIANKIKHSAKVEHLSRQISLFTGQQAISSAYVALGEKESSPCHWDTRDVFAIQLIGRKRWIIYEPSMELPVFTQQSKDYKNQYPCPTDPYMDIILEAGDILYIPRGWWHNPKPLGEPTFHLSVGTFPPLTTDYLSWLFKHIENHVNSRRSLKNWQQDRLNIASVGNHINNLLTNPEIYHRFIDEYNGATRIDSSLALELFGNPNCITFPEHINFRICANCHPGLDSGYIIANGTRINLDSKSKKIIQHIAESHESSTIKLSSAFSELSESDLNRILTELCRQDILEILNH